MTDKYYPRGEIKKLEIEMWNMKGLPDMIQGSVMASKPKTIQEAIEIANDQMDQKGLPDLIQGSVMASKPKTIQEAIEIANDQMDQKVRTFADRQAKNKRLLDDNTRNNQTQQQPFKRQNVAWAYTFGPGEKKVYVESLPLYTKCNYHHNGQCAPKCNNCKKVGEIKIIEIGVFV
uniref:Reverse transcriptase domain-containing protein n=1 Tax=Tanacetum cinerariifolium TaxID=118510 RepID=A0A6L2LLP9_TANCI|nr:hypothetical protein [Tanacetum cinerariifolium]